MPINDRERHFSTIGLRVVRPYDWGGNVTTQTGTERKNPAKPEGIADITPRMDDMLSKDLPRPVERTTGTKPPAPLEVASGAEPSYNTIDLGGPVTSVDILRPVELGREAPDSRETSAPPESPTQVAYAPVPARTPTGEVRTSDAPPAAGDTTDSMADTQPPTAPPLPRNPNLKAALAGGVMGPQVSTKAVPAHRTPARTESPVKSRLWLKIAGYAGATIVAVIAIAYLVAKKPAVGTINGVVVDAQSGRIIPSAIIELDGKRTATTNIAGLYTFADIATGSYMLKASAPGYEPQTGTVNASAPQAAQLSFALAPSAPTAPAPATPVDPADGSDSSQSTASTSSSPGFGGIELVVDFDGYLVFVDGEIYGKNARKLKRLSSGEHRIVVQADGFQDYSTTVTVKARSTATITIAKADLTPKIDPIKRSHGLFASGKDLIDRGLWEAAIDSFNSALGFDPHNADAVRYRGWAYMKSGDTVKAMDDFAHAAQMYDDTRRAIEAVTCAGYMIDLRPDDPALLRKRSDYYLSLREYGKAISDIERAIKMDKKSVENQMALGEAYYASGDFRRAAKEFDRARKMSGDPLRPYIRMILAYYNAGENDELLKKYREFVKIAPQDLLDKLQRNPEWLPVLQMIGPDERHKN